MGHRLALQEIQARAEEADDGERDDSGPEDDTMPGFDDDTEEEEGDAGLAGADGGYKGRLADDFEKVGFRELWDGLSSKRWMCKSTDCLAHCF